MELVWNHQTVYLLLHFQFESSVPSQTTSNNGFSIILTRSSTESNTESTLKNRYKVVFAFFERILKIQIFRSNFIIYKEQIPFLHNQFLIVVRLQRHLFLLKALCLLVHSAPVLND